MLFPEELKAKWEQIIKAAGEIGGWAEGYSRGYINKDESDFPKDAPYEVPVWKDDADDDISWSEWPHRNMYVSMRKIGDTGSLPSYGRAYPEFHFGSFAVFRLTKEEHALLNEGYEDTAGTENERFIEDSDHMIVVYML